MKKLLLLAMLLSVGAFAQRSTIPAPRDANNFPLEAGLGPAYATTVSVTVTAYDGTVRYQVPSDGNDALRAFRHIMILNRSTTRTVSVCFGGDDPCSQNAIIVRPEIGMSLDHVLFGKATGSEYVYFKLDSAGTASIDVIVW